MDTLSARWAMLEPHVTVTGPDDDRPRPVAQPTALDHTWPRKHHAATQPCLAKSPLLPLQFAAPIESLRLFGQIVSRVDQHRSQPVQKFTRHSQHHDSRLPSNGHPHLVGDRESAAALKPFLGHKHGHPFPEAIPLRCIQPLGLPDVAAHDFIPMCRKGLA